MKCQKCGAKIEEGSEYCPKCNTKVISVNGSGQIGNGYNPEPVSPPPFNQVQTVRPDNNVKYICIVIAALLIVSFGVFAVNKLSSSTTDQNDSNTTEPVATNSTYQQKYANFTFNLPENYISENKQNHLEIGDTDGTWYSYVLIAEGTYSIAKNKNNKIKLAFEQDGTSITAYDVNNIDGREYMVYDCTKNNIKSLIAITKLDTNHVIQMQLFNNLNTIDYNLVTKLTPLLESAKYTNTSNRITIPTASANIDLNAIMAEEE